MERIIEQFSEDDGKLYDVIAVRLCNYSVIWVDEKLSLPNAEAVTQMAVARQCVEDQIFKTVPHGTYKVGDKIL